MEVTVTGSDVDDATELRFTHPGITAKLVPPPEEPKDDDKKKKAGNAQKKKAPVTEVKFTVTISKDVPPGSYDARLVNAWGISNPRFFVIGTLPEVAEKEPNNDVPEAQKIELGSTINGTIANPTDVDYYTFTGKKGQRVLASCVTSSIDSRALPLVEVFTGKDGRTRLGENRQYANSDALVDVSLPADGEYFLRITEFAHQRGGPDYFYRLTVSTGPWIDAVFPPVVQAGKPTQVTVFGRNLPGGKADPQKTIDGQPVETATVTITPPADATSFAFQGWVPPTMGLLDAFAFNLPGSNSVPVFLTTLPVVLEKEAGNDRPEGAEDLPVPCEVAGRIDFRYDRDWYSFTAKKGDVFSIDLFADRIGSNMDTFLIIRSAEKNQDIANDNQLDDEVNSLHPNIFFSRNADPSSYTFMAPEDGKYLVQVGSREANVSYGPRCLYRLRIATPQPDFRAVVMARSRDLPATVIARPDGEAAYDVFIDRRDGFTDPVTVTIQNLPAGVTASPCLIGHNQKWGTLVLSGGAGLKDTVAQPKVIASGTIAGKAVTHTARPASITWGIPPNQNNIGTITRLDQSLVLATHAAKAPFRLGVDVNKATLKGSDNKDTPAKPPFLIKPGEKLTVPVQVTWQEAEARAGNLTVIAEPGDQPRGPVLITINNNQPLQLPKDKNDAPVVIDVRTNAVPGVYQINFRGETPIKFARDPEGKDKKDVAVSGYAKPFEIKVIPVSVAKLTAQSPGNLKLGESAEVTVRVERQFNYDGPFTVSLKLPDGAKGVQAQEATIPAGQTEVKVKVSAATDAKPGAINNILVQALAQYEGKYPTPHEAKINLNVVK